MQHDDLQRQKAKFEFQNCILKLREIARNVIPKEDIPDNVYHYTSISGLKGIVETSTIFFTTLHTMNDTSEISYLWDLLKREKETLVEKTDDSYDEFVTKFYTYAESDSLCREIFSGKIPPFLNIFSASFSTDEDSLPIWRGYADSQGVGCRIKFNGAKLSNSFIEKSKNHAASSDDLKKVLHGQGKSVESYKPLVFSRSIIYDNQKQIELLKQVFRQFFQVFSCQEIREIHQSAQRFGILSDISFDDFIYVHLFQAFMILMVFFKNPCFHTEQEYRFSIFEYERLEDEKDIKILERESLTRDKYIVSYVKMPFDQKLIQGVKLAPVNRDEYSRFSIEKFLHDFGVDMPVEFSNIPLRF